MKLQYIALIFLAIIIPLIMVLAYHLEVQQDTMKLQAQYDIKLSEATKEAIKAFEINTVDWSEWERDKTRVAEREDVNAAINTFLTSLANNLNLTGTAKEYMSGYIPAVAMTMYDGYYVYAPNYVPITIRNNQGLELYYDKDKDIVTTDSKEGINSPIYKPKSGVSGVKSAKYTYKDDANNQITENINFVTEFEKAETEYKHVLSSQIAYVARYSKTNTNVVVNYTLDNKIYVYGTVNGGNVNKEGYLVRFNKTLTSLPRITSRPTNDAHINVLQSVENSKYNNIEIDSEILEEQILYYESGSYYLENFNYIHDIESQKLYYDNEKDNFFTYNTTTKERNFILNDSSVRVGSANCKYKSISVLYGTSSSTKDFKRIYQVLNGADKGKWYVNLKTDSTEANQEGLDEVDIEIKAAKLHELGLSNSKEKWNMCKDYRAISYYVEAYAFTNWVNSNLSGVKIYNEETNQYESVKVNGQDVNVFDITSSNNPEKETSAITLHKKDVMKDNVITNLNLSISNYSRGRYGFKLPILSEQEWEQVFSNISLITFFQGVPIKLKYYNNYAIATSTANREFVDPNEIYFSGNDINYHRPYCEKCLTDTYTGYRSIEYVLRTYTITGSNENIYYYQHDNQLDANSETACYYCIVNRANYEKNETENQKEAYYEALARERYYQNTRIRVML